MAELVASLYVHAPFCARRCVYCDFPVTVYPPGNAEPWAKTLAMELAWVEESGGFALAPLLSTLYVGGGTPSHLGPEAMTALARVLGPGRLAGPGLEWTAEANPESFTGEVAAVWSRAGVNRVSLGAQTFHDSALEWLGRGHGPEAVRRAVERAREVGIENISVDLLFGLPEEIPRDWRRDLEEALALDVPHLSVYGLTVEPDTPLDRQVRKGVLRPAPEDRFREEFLLADEILTAAGYLHYEVSNYARSGRRARHNEVYWQGRPYLGLGNGAHSFRPPVRCWNLRDWGAYEESVRRGSGGREGEETVEEEEAALERIWLDLRTVEGLSLEGLGAGATEKIAGWVRRGLAMRDESSTVRLTPEGWLLLDELTAELAAAASCDRPLPSRGLTVRPGSLDLWTGR